MADGRGQDRETPVPDLDDGPGRPPIEVVPVVVVVGAAHPMAVGGGQDGETPVPDRDDGPGPPPIEVVPVVVVSQTFPARPSWIPEIRDFVRRCLRSEERRVGKEG